MHKTELDVFGPYMGCGIQEVEMGDGNVVECAYATIDRLHLWETDDLLSLLALINAELSQRAKYI